MYSHLLKRGFFFEFLDLGELAIGVRIFLQCLFEDLEILLFATEAVVAHYVNHHLEQCNHIVLPTGPEKFHLIYTCKEKISLKHTNFFTFFDMSVLLFIILELIYEPKINDGNSKFRRMECLFIFIADHHILGLHIVESSPSLVYNLYNADQLEHDRQDIIDSLIPFLTS